MPAKVVAAKPTWASLEKPLPARTPAGAASLRSVRRAQKPAGRQNSLAHVAEIDPSGCRFVGFGVCSLGQCPPHDSPITSPWNPRKVTIARMGRMRSCKRRPRRMSPIQSTPAGVDLL